MGMTQTNVDAASLKVVSEMVLENLKVQPGLMLGKYIDASEKAQPGVKQVDFVSFTSLSAENVSSSISGGDATLASNVLDLNIERVVAFTMAKRAIEQNAVDFYDKLAASCADVIRRDWDAQLVTKLYAGVSASSPDNILTASGGTLAKADINNIVEALDLANVPEGQRFLGIHPTDHKALRAISDFMDAEKIGSANTVTGQIGELYGLKVIKSTAFTAASPLAWWLGSIAGAMQRQPAIDTQTKFENNLSVQFFVSYLGGAKVIRPEAVVKVTASGT